MICTIKLKIVFQSTYIYGYFQKSVKTTQITKVTVFFEKGMEGKYLSSHLPKKPSL